MVQHTGCDHCERRQVIENWKTVVYDQHNRLYNFGAPVETPVTLEGQLDGQDYSSYISPIHGADGMLAAAAGVRLRLGKPDPTFRNWAKGKYPELWLDENPGLFIAPRYLFADWALYDAVDRAVFAAPGRPPAVLCGTSSHHPAKMEYGCAHALKRGYPVAVQGPRTLRVGTGEETMYLILGEPEPEYAAFARERCPTAWENMAPAELIGQALRASLEHP